MMVILFFWCLQEKKKVSDYLSLVSAIYESVTEAVLNSVTKATGLAGILAKNDIIV